MIRWSENVFCFFHSFVFGLKLFFLFLCRKKMCVKKFADCTKKNTIDAASVDE